MSSLGNKSDTSSLGNKSDTMLMRRLYLQIYFIVIASLVLVAVLSVILWSIFGQGAARDGIREAIARLAQHSLPAASAPVSVQRESLVRLGQELEIDITLFDTERRLIAASAAPSPPPRKQSDRHGWQRGPGATMVLSLPDGRFLVINLGHSGGVEPPLNLILFLVSVALSVGIVSYPSCDA